MTATEPRPLALVTGASSGIGLELAREFAEHGFNLVIAAEDERINDAAPQLRNGIAVEAVQVDLATDAGVEQLWQRVRCQRRHPEAAALNAGIGVGGAFAGGTALESRAAAAA